MIVELATVGIAGVIVLALVFFIWSAFWLWWQSILSNAPVSLLQIIFMRFRKVNPSLIVTVRITAKKAGIDLSADELEAHTLAGGRVDRVVQARVSASKASISSRCCCPASPLARLPHSALSSSQRSQIAGRLGSPSPVTKTSQNGATGSGL